MIRPIYLYGNPVLREKCIDINKDYPKLKELIDDMFETMYEAEGIGLAAPQIGLTIRMFVVDLSPLAEDNQMYDGFKKVFINPVIIEEKDNNVKYNEGCLSIPGIHESVERNKTIVMKYYDENFVEHTDEFSDFFARCIQHEYDHIEGILFIDKITPIRKQMINSKLKSIIKGKKSTFYKTRN